MASIINATTTAGVSVQGDNSGSLQLATNNGTTAVTITTGQNVGIGVTATTQKLWVNGNTCVPDDSVFGFHTNPSAGAISNYYSGSDGSNYLRMFTGGSERMRIDSSGNVGIGSTSSGNKFEVAGSGMFSGAVTTNTTGTHISYQSSNSQIGAWGPDASTNGTLIFYSARSNGSNGLERMRIDSSGALLVGKTAQNSTAAGSQLNPSGAGLFTVDGSHPILANRLTSDGDLVVFQQASTTEGTISVSGSTVSYNGGHLSRWSQLPDGSKDDTILKGTVLTNLDDMCVWEKEGVVANNEQLNKMKVSDVEGDTNVAGVFVNWTIDADYGVDDMNVAMTGDMIIRIADGVVVQKGDLLISAGDGTAKPQGDDIVRSKTIAKVTSNHITCTYADGSYCVPCVLMAC